MNYLLREKPLELSSSKVPEITFAFWVMKVAATTLGETGGDAVSMTMHLGYALSSAIFLAFFLATATVQLSSRIAAGSRRTQFRAHHLIPGDRDLHLRVHPVYLTKGG